MAKKSKAPVAKPTIVGSAAGTKLGGAKAKALKSALLMAGPIAAVMSKAAKGKGRK
jgi:hypothetical protein